MLVYYYGAGLYKVRKVKSGPSDMRSLAVLIALACCTCPPMQATAEAAAHVRKTPSLPQVGLAAASFYSCVPIGMHGQRPNVHLLGQPNTFLAVGWPGPPRESPGGVRRPVLRPRRGALRGRCRGGQRHSLKLGTTDPEPAAIAGGCRARRPGRAP